MNIYLDESNRFRYEPGYREMKKAADLGNYHAKWLLDAQTRNGDRSEDLTRYFKDTPLRDPKLPPNAPHFPGFNFAKPQIPAQQPTINSPKPKRVPDDVYEKITATCQESGEYVFNMALIIASGKVTKDDVLVGVRRKGANLWGGYSFYADLADQMFRKKYNTRTHDKTLPTEAAELLKESFIKCLDGEKKRLGY